MEVLLVWYDLILLLTVHLDWDHRNEYHIPVIQIDQYLIIIIIIKLNFSVIKIKRFAIAHW